MPQREGFDLFSKYGRRVFWRDLTKHGFVNSLMWRDTFGRFACFFVGHNAYKTYEGEQACKLCCKYIA